MKKILIVLMLTITSIDVFAELMQVTESKDLTLYVYPTTIRAVGAKVKMWDLTDYKRGMESHGASGYYWSSKAQIEYDCEEEQSRILTFSHFSEPKGQGRVLYSHEEPSKWKPIMPESMGQNLWEIACDKRQ
ncbi:surface-adhesin E family protein [Nitrosospira sp. Nsp13]|uniref:surface-adhesin E family protein n=1 Tax=Nitrosospira sp. Nsp13 TaxID=1855332 RepID=UPI0008833F9A|nr:surface-adhesin E family protein [Nitrosospira sp. Nsp13]SCX98311.1 hypothetical protein SAMN05216308_102263 [Nitrosospira sp. Nsp13]